MSDAPDPRAVVEMAAFDAMPPAFKAQIERTGVSASSVARELIANTQRVGPAAAQERVLNALKSRPTA